MAARSNTDPLHTKLCDMLGVELPIVAFTHCRDVAVAATNAGGFAVLGEAMKTSDEIAENIRWIRERVGGRPFGVDLVLPSSAPPKGTPQELLEEIPEQYHEYARRIKEKYEVPDPKNAEALHRWGGLNKSMGRSQIEVLLDERVDVIATGLGSPDFLIPAAHERGQKVIGLVGRPRQAELQIERGVDAVVAQGYDAAGHTSSIGTFSIVSEVAAIAGETPVIAAGGVTTGRHLAAALCLGASGVWTGTVWLASEESDIEEAMKERIIAAGSEDSTRNNYISGKMMRVLRCPWTDEWDRSDAPPVLQTPYQMLLSSAYIQAANDHLRADLMTEAVGQGVGFVNDRRPTREILLQMADEAREIFAQRAS